MPGAASHSRNGWQTFVTGARERASSRGSNGLRPENVGDVKALRDGVSEMRIDWGPGYRVYFGRDGQAVVILLCGGDKRRQDADIRKAVDLWQEYVSRKKGARRPGN